MPDPRQQDHSLGEGGLMFGKYITVYDGVWSAEVLKSRGGTPLFKPYTYAPLQRVMVFRPFWSENGCTFCPFRSGIGYGFRENYRSV